MKKVLIVALAVVSQVTFAQVTKKLGDFNELKVYDKLSVDLIESSENKVVITGNRENEVEVVNKNGELKLRMPFPKLLSGEDIKIKLYFKNIDGITASEGSYVTSDAVFKQTIINLNAKEGSEINLNLDTQKVNVKAVTGGIIELAGKAVNQDVTIMSGGNLASKELHTSQTTISVSAGGSAEINATTLVDAKVKAGGSIYIYGKPKQINKETLLGGKIEEKE
ncbi:head GIN domain-containing protein [Flavobacterium granuli]|uniref:Autotransporter adhesin-like protein n=1 Tax=Flavobacterium granuli TaxID=280093 RepID=A0A1M5KD07_9FLAO|nr:head GIN domain-containing protein [Flavobacterium granuli]PRZ26246.1 putative autotransporter adhesin-like protein [Flavobacterium granuli]SHG50625.1 Putative auto-transporter adhesin, head GIN domain [Flavobacterium granuli]